MNWKSSLLGAVLVAVAGLVVGIAVGGKTKTDTTTRTETVVSTAKVTVTSPALPASNTGTSTTSSSTTSSTPTTTSGGGGGSSKEYYATYLAGQNNNAPSTNASLSSDPSSLELKGQTYANAVALDLSVYGGPIDSYQFPIPGFTSFNCPIAGFQTSASQKTSYQLTIYKNNDNPGATVLYTATFTGPSGTHPIKFKTQGATDLIFDFKKLVNEPDWENGDQFIMADPVVTTS